ncbi:hypothetical protein LSAT2_002725 [Lamellibrachia satsuma]|nr:hypothetical protein LSAT2_002725 [Lamellibrachia satsuma]
MESAGKTTDVAQKEVETDMAADTSGGAATRKTESKNLDLAFAMDCTGSMGSYIHQAQQESTFVTRVNDFTSSVRSMKQWLDNCSASGGGDTPEAVADALHQVKKLRWRDDSTKICCPDGLDPMVVTRELAEKGITLYMVGCEPSITPYKDFFMALAHLTGGQYIPLARAEVLATVIVGGAQEELSLQQLMEDVNLEVVNECAEAGEEDVDTEELTRKVHMKLKSKGRVVKQLHMNKSSLASASESAKQLSCANTMNEVQSNFTELPSAAPAPRGRGMAKIKKKKSAGGFSLFKMGRSDVCDDGERMDERCLGGASVMEEVAQSYEVVEDELNLAQASRLVQKSLATNRLQAKMKK